MSIFRLPDHEDVKNLRRIVEKYAAGEGGHLKNRPGILGLPGARGPGGGAVTGTPNKWSVDGSGNLVPVSGNAGTMQTAVAGTNRDVRDASYLSGTVSLAALLGNIGAYSVKQYMNDGDIIDITAYIGVVVLLVHRDIDTNVSAAMFVVDTQGAAGVASGGKDYGGGTIAYAAAKDNAGTFNVYGGNPANTAKIQNKLGYTAAVRMVHLIAFGNP